jgi:hypothetical protein
MHATHSIFRVTRWSDIFARVGIHRFPTGALARLMHETMSPTSARTLSTIWCDIATLPYVTTTSSGTLRGALLGLPHGARTGPVRRVRCPETHDRAAVDVGPVAPCGALVAPAGRRAGDRGRVPCKCAKCGGFAACLG